MEVKEAEEVFVRVYIQKDHALCLLPIAIKAPFTHYAACQLSCLADFVAEQVRQTLLPGEVRSFTCSV